LNKNLYDVLGLSSTASQEDIDLAARRLLGVLESRRSSGGLDIQAIAVKEAHQVLSNPQTRATYDLRMQSQPGPSRAHPLDDFRYPDEPAPSNAFLDAIKPIFMSGRALIALSILIAVSVYSYYMQAHRKAVVTVVERAHMDAQDKMELQELRQELGGRLTPEEIAAYEAKRREEEKRLELSRQQQQFGNEIARFTAEQNEAEREKMLEREREQQRRLEREQAERERLERELREQEMASSSVRPRMIK
jgi:curved DNA-binding protein CbpA